MKMTNTIRIIGAIVLLMISKFNVSGQYASGIPYMFTETISTPPIFPTTGTVNIITPASQVDDWDTLITPAGFSFQFAGLTYTKIIISTNGWLALAPSQTFSGQEPPPLPDNLLSNNTTGFPIIAPLWDDLSTSVFTYNVTGGSLWVRWTCRWNKLNPAAASSLFWIKLDMSDNSITFYYANNIAYTPTLPSASIGIAGICPGDYYSVFYSGSNTYVDSMSEDTAIGVLARPYNTSFKFYPVSWNDECGSSTFPDTISSCMTYHASNHHSTVSTQGMCSLNDSNDVWFSFVKPIGVSGVTIMTSPDSCHSVSGTTIEVFESCAYPPIACSTTSLTYPDFGSVELFRSDTVAETLYVRVTSDNNLPGKYLICAYNDTSITSVANYSIVKISPEIFSNDKTLIIESKNQNSDGVFELYNLQGRKIKSGEITEGKNEIHCDELPDGIYIVKVMLNGTSVNRKIPMLD